MNWSKINTQAEQHRQNPPGDTWDKIDFRLSSSSGRIIKPWATWMKYAVAFFFVSGSFWILKNQTRVHEAAVFEIVQEEEPISPIYTSQNIVELKAAYAKAGINSPSRSKSGM